VQRFLLIAFVASIGVLTATSMNNASTFKDKGDVGLLSVEDMLSKLGDKPLLHAIDKVDPAKVKLGEDLVFNGRTMYNGKKSRKISNHFVCTDCHNTTSEFKDISSQNSAERLKFAEDNGIPFLPGSTLWGIYDRTTFYNDDYVKKYGDLVDNARDTLSNAVQLCAKYCSSGRYLDEWEVEAIMHYFKSNQLHLSDLNLSKSEKKNLSKYQKLDDQEKKDMIAMLKSKYRQSYSATFMETMPTDQRKYGEGGNAENGKKIYEKSCMFCHEDKRVTYLHIDNGKLSGRFFWSNIKNYKDQNVYQIVRHGTYSKAGRKQYMPHFTKEKMSDDQLNDLVAYIKQIAGK